MSDLFHVRYSVRNFNIGAPVLTLDLLVNTVQKTITGSANVSQSVTPVEPPFHADVWGRYSQVGTNIVLTLDGNPSGPTSQIAETFHLHGVLTSNWASGSASYSYFTAEGKWVTIGDARVTATSESEEPPYGPRPLYAAALQQAQRSGDTSQAQALAQQASDFLDSSNDIRAALAALTKEIEALSNSR